MNKKFSEILKKLLKSGSETNDSVLTRLNKAIENPELVTLDPQVTQNRKEIKFTSDDIEMFFTFAALGMQMAEENPIAGLKFSNNINIVDDRQLRNNDIEPSPYSISRGTSTSADGEEYQTIHLSLSALANLLIQINTEDKNSINFDINLPEMLPTAHELIVSFLEETRHANQGSIPADVLDEHYQSMRRDIPVHEEYKLTEDGVRYTASNAETDARNLKYKLFIEGNGCERVAKTFRDLQKKQIIKASAQLCCELQNYEKGR